MFTFKDVKRLVRFKLKDNNEVSYSDYEIKEATNEVLRYLSNSYALQNTDFLEDAEEYTNDDATLSVKDLPDDFVTLLAINSTYGYAIHPCSVGKVPSPTEYYITGGKIICGCPSFNIVYRKMIPEVKADTDTIDFPYTFKDSIVKLVCMVLLNNPETDVMQSAVNDAVASIVPRRRYVNGRIPMPF